MTDTPEKVAALYRRLLLQRSGEERLRMGCEMFDAARALVRASLTSSTADGRDSDLRIKLLRRTYGLDLDPDVLAGVEARLMGLR
jgi:hypothetical protein